MQQSFQRQITLKGTTYRSNLNLIATGLQGRIWKVYDDAVNFSAIKTMNENYFSYKKYENESSNSEQINHFEDLANQLDNTIKQYIKTRQLIISLYDKYPPDDSLLYQMKRSFEIRFQKMKICFRKQSK